MSDNRIAQDARVVDTQSASNFDVITPVLEESVSKVEQDTNVSLTAVFDPMQQKFRDQSRLVCDQIRIP